MTVTDQTKIGNTQFQNTNQKRYFQSFGSVRMHGALPSLALVPAWRDAYAVVEYCLHRCCMHSTFPRSSWQDLH